MTRRDPRVPFQHMLELAQKAVALTQGITGEEFSANEVVVLATVRLLEVVGEAASRVSQDLRLAYPDIPWRRMVALRNLLIHAYDQVDQGIVWDIVQEDLPELIEALKRIDFESLQ